MHLYLTQMDPPPQRMLDALAERGWTLHHLPFRQVVLHEDVHLPETRYDALLVTSKNAARWLVPRLGIEVSPIATVGRATASLFPPERLLFRDAPANAEELLNQLRIRFPGTGRFLFMRGEQVSPTIPNGLNEDRLDQLVVYHTAKKTQILTALARPAMVYFQAPSTVADFKQVFGQPPEWVAAIGPTTARAIAEHGWRVDFRPTRPENESFAAELPGPHEMREARIQSKRNGDL